MDKRKKMSKEKTIRLIPSVILTVDQYYQITKAAANHKKFIITATKGTFLKDNKVDTTLELELEW